MMTHLEQTGLMSSTSSSSSSSSSTSSPAQPPWWWSRLCMCWSPARYMQLETEMFTDATEQLENNLQKRETRIRNLVDDRDRLSTEILNLEYKISQMITEDRKKYGDELAVTKTKVSPLLQQMEAHRKQRAFHNLEIKKRSTQVQSFRNANLAQTLQQEGLRLNKLCTKHHLTIPKEFQNPLEAFDEEKLKRELAIEHEKDIGSGGAGSDTSNDNGGDDGSGDSEIWQRLLNNVIDAETKERTERARVAEMQYQREVTKNRLLEQMKEDGYHDMINDPDLLLLTQQQQQQQEHSSSSLVYKQEESKEQQQPITTTTTSMTSIRDVQRIGNIGVS